jgi:hypothetical protein
MSLVIPTTLPGPTAGSEESIFPRFAGRALEKTFKKPGRIMDKQI